jgi:hypothetical protein
MTAMFPSSAAVVMLLSRSICPVLSSTRWAAVFSLTRVARLVSGIGGELNQCTLGVRQTPSTNSLCFLLPVVLAQQLCRGLTHLGGQGGV